VTAGRIAVNGVVLMSPAVIINPHTDQVSLDGRVLKHTAPSRRAPDMFILHKLPKELVTRSDPEGRPTIFDRLPAMGLPDNLIAVVRGARGRWWCGTRGRWVWLVVVLVVVARALWLRLRCGVVWSGLLFTAAACHVCLVFVVVGAVPNTMQCNAMQCDAMRCNAMQCDSMRCDANVDAGAT